MCVSVYAYLCVCMCVHFLTRQPQNVCCCMRNQNMSSETDKTAHTTSKYPVGLSQLVQYTRCTVFLGYCRRAVKCRSILTRVAVVVAPPHFPLRGRGRGSEFEFLCTVVAVNVASLPATPPFPSPLVAFSGPPNCVTLFKHCCCSYCCCCSFCCAFK